MERTSRRDFQESPQGLGRRGDQSGSGGPDGGWVEGAQADPRMHRRSDDLQSHNMNRETDPEGSTTSRSATGTVRARFRSAWLGWTDPHTGERLTVRMDGDAELVSELVSEGFELLRAAPVGDSTLDGTPCESAPYGEVEPTGTRHFASPAVEAEVRAAGKRRAG